MKSEMMSKRSPLQWFFSRNLKLKLVIALIPPVVCAVLFTGYLNYRISNRYTEIGLERSVAIQTMALAHELEARLETYRLELLDLTRSEISAGRLHDAIEKPFALGSPPVVAVAYFPPSDNSATFLVAKDGEAVELSEEMLGRVRPSPFTLLDALEGLSLGEVKLLPTTEVELPVPHVGNMNRSMMAPLVRMITPVADARGGTGLLLLAFDAKELRNILTLYNSPQSPIYAFPRSDEHRYGYMFDSDGWILFETGVPDDRKAELSTFSSRSGVDGVLGRPGLSSAFRPTPERKHYWKMISSVAEGNHDMYTLQRANQGNDRPTSIMAYAPVRFRGSLAAPSTVIGGVAFVDRSQLPLVAGYRHLDLMFFVTLATMVVLVTLVIVLARFITKPIINLAQAVRDIDLANLHIVEITNPSYETDLLKNALNSMVSRLQEQKEENRLKDEEIRFASLQERATLEFEENDADAEDSPLPEIIGTGPHMAQLKSDILKAARVDVDVLIIGETGTGKQLAAEAIHNHSARADKPFISINCGALDESLLLDTLFGHTKGAFTEAKTDRKGAFLEADGGTLFLDEIQATSLMGQQALLRALAMRKIKPLGSDREIDVNVRLITATNVDLLELIDEKKFREDLYYRLRVLTINVPPLREHPESIPAIALHYLRQAEELVGKFGLGLSRGAVEKMNAYDWPGNIRELVNCITRAAVMVEGSIIQAHDIQLEGVGQLLQLPLGMIGSTVGPAQPTKTAEESPPQAEADGKAGHAHGSAPSSAPPPRSAAGPASPSEAVMKASLNERQQKAYPALMERGTITRSEYQELLGGDLSSRTAVYDLNDLVQKGLLEKVGSGPATRYILALEKPLRKEQ